MASRVTHEGNVAVREIRIGGTGKTLKGSQPMAPVRPRTWYPNNLPIAPASTVSDGQISALLDMLNPLVAHLVMMQSFVMGACYRYVPQVPVAVGSPFTLNGVTGYNSISFFDQNSSYSETVYVDLVTKNPALAFDLAVRLAAQVAASIDRTALGQYASFTPSAVGTAQTTPTATVLQNAGLALPVTGEPILLLMKPQAILASQAAGTMLGQEIQILPSTRMFRAIPCDFVGQTGVATPTQHNVAMLPSAMAICSSSLGNSTGSTTNIVSGIPGNVQKRNSTYLESDTGTPQLVLQLVMGNSGSGAQTIYVNGNVAPIVINPANGVQVLS